MTVPGLLGHRGARFEVPENTIAGFRYARKLGIKCFELDVRLTNDHQLAIIHDGTVDRTTDGAGPVHAFSAAELAALDARSIHADWPERVGVPTLPELFSAFAGDAEVEWTIEIKRDDDARLDLLVPILLETMTQFGLKERVIVSSFEPGALERVKQHDPTQRIAFIGRYDGQADLDTAKALGCMEADIPVATGSAEIVRAALDAGMAVVGWPGNSAEQLDTLVSWGVTVICTDAPTFAMGYLRDVSKAR